MHIPHSDLMREVFLNPADVGGRYSALSYVGLVPGGADGPRPATRCSSARRVMAEALRGSPSADNPGVWLGVALGCAGAGAGRDKLTLVIEPGDARASARGSSSWSQRAPASTAWASSPSTARRWASRGVRRRPRLRSHLGQAEDACVADRHHRGARCAGAAGHPVDRHCHVTPERAWAPSSSAGSSPPPCAGAVLGINPFDEPNVTESKDNTKTRARALPRRTGRAAAGRADRDRWPAQPSATTPLSVPARHDGLTTPCAGTSAARQARSYVATQAYLARSASTTRPARACATAARRDRAGRHHWLRPALPALDRPAAQGRRAAGLLHPADRRAQTEDLPIPGSAGNLRHAHRRTGGGRLRRARDARPARRCASTSRPTPTPA